jgi:hypothetical protein
VAAAVDTALQPYFQVTLALQSGVWRALEPIWRGYGRKDGGKPVVATTTCRYRGRDHRTPTTHARAAQLCGRRQVVTP